MVDTKGKKAAKATKSAPAVKGRKSLKPELPQLPEIVVISGASLEDAQKTGTVLKGILEKAEPNKYYPNNKDYFFRTDDQGLTILRGCTALATQLDQPGVVGMKLEVVYNGKKKSNIPGRKPFFDFEVFTLAS